MKMEDEQAHLSQCHYLEGMEDSTNLKFLYLLVQLEQAWLGVDPVEDWSELHVGNQSLDKAQIAEPEPEP